MREHPKTPHTTPRETLEANGLTRLARITGAFAAVFALLVFAASPATAATASSSYGYFSSFGDGEAFYPNPAFNAVAVDGGSGNILVAEYVNFISEWGAVQVYSPDPAVGGVPLASLNLQTSQITPVDVAVDQTDGSLYLADGATNTISRFVSDGAPVPTYKQDLSFVSPSGLLTYPGGLAVDPVTHDVLVADRNTFRVYRLNANGGLVSSFDGSDGSNKPGSTISNLGSLAVGPSGTIYVDDDFTGSVRQFSSTGVLLGSLPIADGGRASNLAVNPQSGDIAVRVGRGNQSFIEGFSAQGRQTFSSRIPSQAAGGSTGLAWDAGTDRLYLGTGTGAVETFVPATKPGVDAPVVSQLTATGVHVAAAVATGGVATAARIEYCPATAACSDYLVSDPSDPANPWVRLPDHSLPDPQHPAVDGVDTIEDDLTGLTPNSSYLVRVSAANALTDNTSSSTTVSTLLLPPVVQTGLAGAVTDSQAGLTGTIDTYGDQTVYHFEYGLTTGYGSSAPAGAEGVAGDSRTPRTFSRTITGLQPGMIYHYRLVAHNSAGVAAGADRTFTTEGIEEVAPSRAYEEVTPVDKENGAISAFGFQADADGSGVAYINLAVGANAASAPLAPWYLSRRGTSGWENWLGVDPPLSVSRLLVGGATQAVSADFNHALVVSNRVLAPGAIEGGGNVYVVDLRSGAYSLVGAASGLAAYLAMNGPQPPNMYIEGAPDFSWLVLASSAEAPLLSGVTGAALYKWTQDDGLKLESRLPDGSVPSGSISMQTRVVLSTREASEDGNTMYFALGGPEAGIYRRANGQTMAISVSQIPGEPATLLPGELDGTSSDGQYVFFRSGRLTADAPIVNVNLRPADLYRYDSEKGGLTYIGSAANTDQGRVIGIGDDGQTIYYNHHSPEGEAVVSDTVVWRRGVSHTVTTEHPDLTADGMDASLSPDGRFLAYLADGDVQLYDADTNETACASCRPGGSPGGTAVLALGNRGVSNRAQQVVTDDGTVFFDTTLPLVSADHNGTRDVYAYRAGHLTLISPGDGNFTARFADATPDGKSVFFTTDESLVGQDIDQALDVYVARVEGGFASQNPAAPWVACSGQDCRAQAPGTSAGLVAGSVTFSGPGNLVSGFAVPALETRAVSRVKTITGSAGSLKVKVPARGRLVVSGGGLVSVRKTVSRAASYTIRVSLSSAARKQLRRSGTLERKAKLTFTPVDGKASTVSLTLTFKVSTTNKKGR